MASGKQLSSGCAVVLKFYVDEEDFLHLKRFHHQARDPQYIPGAPHLQMQYCVFECCSAVASKALGGCSALLVLKQPKKSESMRSVGLAP